MRVTDRDWDLIQREIDGANTEDDSRGLRDRRAREPELDARYRALVDLEHTLGQVELVEAPSDLAGDIMRQVRHRARVRGTRGSRLSGVFARLVQRPALGLAASLAVGFLGGVLLTSLAQQPSLDRIDEGAVSGTSLPSRRLSERVPIDELLLEAEGIHATAKTRGGPGVVVAEIAVETPGSLELIVELDGRALRPQGLEAAAGLPAGEVVVGTNQIRIRQAPGGLYLLTLAINQPAPPPLRVRLESGDVAVAGELATAAP
jgi:hypothetical protein